MLKISLSALSDLTWPCSSTLHCLVTWYTSLYSVISHHLNLKSHCSEKENFHQLKLQVFKCSYCWHISLKMHWIENLPVFEGMYLNSQFTKCTDHYLRHTDPPSPPAGTHSPLTRRWWWTSTPAGCSWLPWVWWSAPQVDKLHEMLLLPAPCPSWGHSHMIQYNNSDNNF